MHTLASIANEDERLEQVQLDADQPNLLGNRTAPVLSTPAALVTGVVTVNSVANAIW
ncbi:hypothetical protein ACFW4O_33260 [Streptomyces mutabilis]|uniref:hypothetical protein n=1 Tax=Streptomyces TaxID=1883 RepID=UPI0015CE9EC9|nr:MULTISPECIES: hypothetical protein [unclassified Streptomyces]MDN3250952.1 hypothetical protein [Streptomyces sp. ZSW22]MDN3257808.1 hypothetical protein [Streptomyces sp. MA25(2023)]